MGTMREKDNRPNLKKCISTSSIKRSKSPFSEAKCGSANLVIMRDTAFPYT